MDLLSQQPLFSTVPETKGFDLSSGNKWIYPENYPIREYQFKIVKTSLFHNTLVCLPTGLGKTFIAAVVMYNFWRWYPRGLIVFLAPTKPLVAQQIDACHDIMGIPISETIELTGATNQKQREIAWRNKRVIFATPQTFQKDLEKGIMNTELIKCVVIDEAHRALGKHSYCESIRILHQTNCYYRLLALSATPGGKLDAVQDVIRNLHITHLELRDDTSSDITPYINERKLEIIQVDLGNDLTRFHEKYIEIMDPYFRVLLKNNVIRGVTSNITKGRIFHVRKEFMSRQNKPYNYGSIVKTLNILLSMCHANELLVNHGLRAFVHFYQNHSDKFWLKDEPNLSILLDEIKDFIGPFPEIQSLMDGVATTIPNNIVFGHGKFNKLREILTKHFENAAAKNTDTRAIVFIEFRDIVNEVFILLFQLRPLIRPQVFVGQAGLKQKQQKKALDDFRNNHVNVLISTSVGEEGLDVGEVDLIICFDILQHSPTRLVQRMGRTGRKRDGHIIVLVTDGREHKTLKSALARRDSLNNKVLHSSGIIDALGAESPRMIPPDLNPECLKMRITVIPTTPRSRKQRKKVGPKVKKNNDDNIIDDNDEKKKTKNTKPVTRKNTNSSKNVQNAMMKFLISGSNQNNITQDSDFTNMKFEEVHPIQLQTQSFIKNSDRVKSSDVKLLTSDNESVEFLTLCALKQSTQDMNSEVKLLNITYVPEFLSDYSDFFQNFQVPSVSILNCIKTLGEYTPLITDEFIGADDTENIEIWEPDHFSHFAENPPCPELVLTNGRFEDLLDDTSDSDVTNFSGDQSIFDQQVNFKNNNRLDKNISQEKNDDNINETSLINSVVVDGAFEDLLDECSDESNNEVCEILTKVNDKFDDNILNHKTSLNDTKLTPQKIEEISIVSLITPEKIEKKREVSPMKVDLNLDVDFESDFESWDNFHAGKNSSDSPIISCKNLVKSHDNTPIHSPHFDEMINKGKSQQSHTSNNQKLHTNRIHDCVSPDLSKSSQRGTINMDKISNSLVEKPTTILESAKKTIDEENFADDDDDDDIFGVESLLVDSDFEDQLATVENSNVNENSTGEKNVLKLIESECKMVDNSDSHVLKENNTSDNDFFDDFEWNSDFETSSAVATTSKYFKSNSNQISQNSICAQLPSVNKKSHESLPKVNSMTNKISKSMSKPDKKLITIEQKCSTKIKLRRDSDSDDDFAPKKIEKIVFRKLDNNFSDDEVFCNDPSRLVAGNLLGHSSNENGSKSLFTKNSNTFSLPKPFESKSKFSSPKKPSRAISSRSTLYDSYSKKKKSRKKRGKLKNIFIDDEAEVSTEETNSLSSSDNNGDSDDELADFVSHTQYHDHDSSVDMKALYLQSVKSPRGPGRFLIKKPQTPPPDIEIYSQAIPDEPNTYLCDSFCVEEGDETSENSNHSLGDFSILAEAERKLRKKKRKRKNSSEPPCPKRKRIVTINSDDTSEDETEKMRTEIAEQSMMLKNK